MAINLRTIEGRLGTIIAIRLILLQIVCMILMLILLTDTAAALAANIPAFIVGVLVLIGTHYTKPYCLLPALVYLVGVWMCVVCCQC
jgi:hypothetical protein